MTRKARKAEKKPKAPYHRGARLESRGRSYKVVRCEARQCVHCEGTGLLWTITLRGLTGIFETQLDSLRKGGYIVVAKQTPETTE